MEFFYQLAKSLLLPPGFLLVLLLVGLLLKRRWPILLATGLLYLLSTPFIAGQLSRGLEQYPALTEQQLRQTAAQAIVVLTGGRHTNALEYGGDSVGSATLERLRYAAWLHRRSGLPVILSGGSPFASEIVGEARLAAPVLQDEFAVAPVWIEADSPNTRDNARLSLTLLRQRGIDHILLVSHAWHLPRALQSFAQAGADDIRITPAGTGYYQAAASKLNPGWRRWLPDAQALRQSSRVLHEYLGSLWYRLRGT